MSKKEKRENTFGLIAYKNTKTGKYFIRVGTDIDPHARCLSDGIVVRGYQSDIPDCIITGVQGIGIERYEGIRKIDALLKNEETRGVIEALLTEIFNLGLKADECEIDGPTGPIHDLATLVQELFFLGQSARKK